MAELDVANLSREELEHAVEIIKELGTRERYNRLGDYDPYPYQARFHKTGGYARQRLLMAANRIGKSYCGAMELAFHLTGLYPKWWRGRWFRKPIKAWAGGSSNETTRDICQSELLGNPDDPEGWGSGAIPKKLILKAERKPGVPNAKSTVSIKHISGGTSILGFKAYEMGAEKWMGQAVDVVWLDEEPPREIYSQAVTRTLNKKGMVYMTFTPESGMTETVAQFMNDLKSGQSLTNATWDDAREDVKTVIKKQPGHLNEEVMEQVLAAIPPHEREMRKFGRPSIGSGLVFPVNEEKVRCEPFTIPDHWPRIAGMDLGWDHPTALVWIAWDRDEDCIYVYDAYRQAKTTPAVHAEAINTRPRWIPIIWPHDGNRANGMGGPSLADQYRGLGLNMLPFHFTNPPVMGEKTGKGGNAIEPGIMEILQRMDSERLKVFSTLNDWWEEFRMYHRKEGKIVPLNDDLMSATRYAVMSTRHAAACESEWGKEMKYPALGII